MSTAEQELSWLLGDVKACRVEKSPWLWLNPLPSKRRERVEQSRCCTSRRGGWVIMLRISSDCPQQEVTSTFSWPVSQRKWEKGQIPLDKRLRKVASFLRKLGFSQGWDVQRSIRDDVGTLSHGPLEPPLCNPCSLLTFAVKQRGLWAPRGGWSHTIERDWVGEWLCGADTPSGCAVSNR